MNLVGREAFIKPEFWQREKTNCLCGCTPTSEHKAAQRAYAEMKIRILAYQTWIRCHVCEHEHMAATEYVSAEGDFPMTIGGRETKRFAIATKYLDVVPLLSEKGKSNG